MTLSFYNITWCCDCDCDMSISYDDCHILFILFLEWEEKDKQDRKILSKK